MCKICVDWEMGKMTNEEAWRNLREFAREETVTDQDMSHFFEVAERLKEKEYEDRHKDKT